MVWTYLHRNRNLPLYLIMSAHPYTLPAPETPAQAAVRAVLYACIAEFYRLANFHKQQYIAFWNNPQVTPNQFCEVIGSRGQEWLTDAAASANHIGALATRYNIPLADVLPPEFSVPRLAFTFLSGGRIAVVEVEGKDAWGNPIPDYTPPEDVPEDSSEIPNDGWVEPEPYPAE
jgi:hypothetical protein